MPNSLLRTSQCCCLRTQKVEIRQALCESRQAVIVQFGLAALKPTIDGSGSCCSACDNIHDMCLDFTHTDTHTHNPASVLCFPLHTFHTHTHTPNPAGTSHTHTDTHQTQPAFFPYPASVLPFPHCGLFPLQTTQQTFSPLPLVFPRQEIQHAFSPFPLQAMLFGNDLRDPALQALRFINIACKGGKGDSCFMSKQRRRKGKPS